MLVFRILLIVHFLLLFLSGVELSLVVFKNPDIATLGHNRFTISCSYHNASPGDTVLFIQLLRRRAGESEIIISTFLPHSNNRIYYDSTKLGRTESGFLNGYNGAFLVFYSIECSDKGEYIWTVTSRDHHVNQSLDVLVRAKTTFNQTSQLTYHPFYNLLSEGDEIVFFCSGDVGNEPVGHLGWYYYLKNDTTNPVNVSYMATNTLPVFQPSTCSYIQYSTLKLTMTKEFDKMLIRCTVHQTTYSQFGNGYKQTEHLDIAYAPQISPFGYKAAKQVGDSVTLKCNADSNPVSTYYWILPSNETRVRAELRLVNLTTEDAGEYRCVATNFFNGKYHAVEASANLEVLDVSAGVTAFPVTSIQSQGTNFVNRSTQNNALPTASSISLPVTSIPSSHGATTVNNHMENSSNGTWCMDCDNMIHLKYCDKVTKCSTDEVCYVQAFTRSGNIHAYKSGCMAKNKCQDYDENLHCQHCCDGKFCNTIGCGDSGLAEMHQRGPLCFDCTHAGDEDTCQSVQMCLPGQVCKVEKYEWGIGYHYVMSCSARSSCATKRSLRAIQSRFVLVCSQCCQEDFCNMNCQQVPNLIG